MYKAESFAPLGLVPFSGSRPRACAVGCILAPLRGFTQRGLRHRGFPHITGIRSRQILNSGAQGEVGAYLPDRAFQRIFNISNTMRVPSRSGLMRVPALWAHATGISITLKPYFSAR